MLLESGEEFILPVADGTVKPSGGDQALKTSTLIRNQQIRGKSHHDFLGEWEGSPLAQHFQFFSGCWWSTRWFLVHFGTLHFQPSRWTKSQTLHAERRIMSYSIEIHWRNQGYSYYFGCNERKPHRRLLEHWCVQRFVRLMDRFHTIHLIDGKASRRIHVVREQIDPTANNIKAWSFSVRNLEKYVKKEKQNWVASEKQSSKMAEDFEVFISLNLFMWNSRRSSEVHGDIWKSQRHLLCSVKEWMAESTGRPVARMMITSHNWRVSSKQRNPRECVWKELHQEFMKTTLQEEWVILCNITIWYTNSLRCLKRWKYLKQKQQWTKNEKNLRKLRHGIWRKSETNLTWSTKQQKKHVKIHFPTLMDLCHLKNAELEKKHQKYKGRVVLRGDIVNDDSGSYAMFTEKGPIASQMTAAKVNHFGITWTRRESSRRGIDLHSRKNGRCSEIIENPKSECPDIWIRVPKHKWPTSWSTMEDPFLALERNLYGHSLAGLLWERQFEKVLLEHGWEKIPSWECLFVNREKGLFLSVYVDEKKTRWQETEHQSDLGKYSLKKLIWENQHHSLIISTWGALIRQCQISKDTGGQLQSHVRIANFRLLSWKTTIPSKSSYFFVVLWHGGSCKEMCGTLWWIGTQDYSTTLESICSMHWWPPLQRRRNKICWRIVTSLLSNCFKILILDTNWKTWYCWSNRKIAKLGKTSRKNNCMILRHGRTCSEICGKIQWIDKQERWVIA